MEFRNDIPGSSVPRYIGRDGCAPPSSLQLLVHPWLLRIHLHSPLGHARSFWSIFEGQAVVPMDQAVLKMSRQAVPKIARELQAGTFHTSHELPAFLIMLPMIGPRKPGGSLIASSKSTGRIYGMTCSQRNLLLLLESNIAISRPYWKPRGLGTCHVVVYEHQGIRKTRLKICSILHSSTRTSHQESIHFYERDGTTIRRRSRTVPFTQKS